MLPIHFAPLQGHTDDVYRRTHHRLIGGIERYYTPFVRVEGGDVRSKDCRDIDPKNNVGTPVTPQIIFKNLKEFLFLIDKIEAQGYREVDLNMGCPFPLQARHGRGAGLLTHPDVVASVADAMKAHPQLAFSVKMRLGWDNAEEWRPVVEILNDTPLTHITLHPRTGTQGYKGCIDYDSFEQFYAVCHHPIIYNGDILSQEDIYNIINIYPKIEGIMIGRGLLAKPYLAMELNVHSLKGLAGNLGVNSVYNAACVMLKEIRTGDKSKAVGLFNFVKEEFLLAKDIILKADI